MNAKKFADWIKKQREQKGLTIKEFHQQFNKLLASKGSTLTRSYQWLTGLEKYGEYAKDEIELINALVRFFDCRIILIPNKGLNALTKEEKIEIEQSIHDENITDEKNKELLTRKNIANKSW